MINSLLQMWKEANTPVEYVIVSWMYLLFGIASIGFGKALFELITNPEQFRYITFGLIDYV